MNRSLRIGRIFGINILIHYSWWFVFIFLTWGLATGFFPVFFKGFTQTQYWLMGMVASILLFVSVLLHELSHSLVAKAKKIEVESITLFFFGGVAGITREDIEPIPELLMALAGPLFSLLLAGVFYGIYLLDGSGFWTAVTYYLARLNFVLAIFNLIPGFPLDGGRAFRALLYWYTKDLRKATKIAAFGGRLFAAVLVFFGLLGLFTGSGNALWFIFLGGFLYYIAGVSYEQVVIRQTLGKIPLRLLLKKKFPLLSGKMSFAAFAKKYKYAEENTFVVKDNSFVGILLFSQRGAIQAQTPLRKISVPASESNSLSVQSTAYDAFRKCMDTGLDFVLVVEKKKLLGIVTRAAVVRALMWEVGYGNSKH